MTDIAKTGYRFSEGVTGPIENGKLYVGTTAVSSSAPVPASLYYGTTAVTSSVRLPVINEGTKATYAYAATGITTAATPTDLVTLYGAASKIITVKKIRVHGQATTAGTMPVLIIKRTAANTAGTSAAKTPALMLSTNSAASATLTEYSAKVLS